MNMGVQVSILDTEIEVPNHNYVSSVEDIAFKVIDSNYVPT